MWTELLSQAPQQYVVAASCPWMGAWLCLMMQASHIPIDLNMLLEVKARSKVVLSIQILYHLKLLLFFSQRKFNAWVGKQWLSGHNIKKKCWHFI